MGEYVLIDFLLSVLDSFFSFCIVSSSSTWFISLCVICCFAGMVQLFKYFLRGF